MWETKLSTLKVIPLPNMFLGEVVLCVGNALHQSIPVYHSMDTDYTVHKSVRGKVIWQIKYAMPNYMLSRL